MKRIYTLVEGHTEREFVSRILAPFFGEKGILISPIPMLKSGGGMGFSNLAQFKNNVKRLLHEVDQPIITTMVDLYRFPVHSDDASEETALKQYSIEPNITTRISGFKMVMDQAVQKIKPYPFFIPYIQKYEFEALLFSDPNAFSIEDDAIRQDVEAVLHATSGPEEINTSEKGHPAQRLIDIYASHDKKYQKGADAVDIAEVTGIETILAKCPNFRLWIETLTNKSNE